jgi:hypothetical protein
VDSGPAPEPAVPVEVPPADTTGGESVAFPFAPPASEGAWIEPIPAAPAPSAPEAAPAAENPSLFAPQSTTPTFVDYAPAAAPEGPIPNGGFDGTADGWRGSNSALEVIPDGVAGQAVRVSRANGRDAFALVAGKPVASPKVGARYRAGAYVRSLSPGMFVCLRSEEYATPKARVPVTTERCRAVTSGWQRLRVVTRTTAKGSKVVFSVRVIAALGGTSFDVDGFNLS